jgi:hypothetical protein
MVKVVNIMTAAAERALKTAADDESIAAAAVMACDVSGDDALEPTVAEQQQPRPRLMAAWTALSKPFYTMSVREEVSTEVCSIITNAVAAGTGNSVYLHGPEGSGKFSTLLHGFDVEGWCKQNSKPKPIDHFFDDFKLRRPSIYGTILDALRIEGIVGIPVGELEPAEARKHLETVLFATKDCSSSSDNVPMIVLRIDCLDEVASELPLEVQQLFAWARMPRCRLVLIGTGSADLPQVLPNLQQHDTWPVQVVMDLYTESELMSKLEIYVGAAVRPQELKLCATRCGSEVETVYKLCKVAVELAFSDSCNNSSDIVTAAHMIQAVHIVETGDSLA